MTRSVAVVGGGISGAAAAYAIKRSLPDVVVTLFERSPRLGGKLHTVELEGTLVEAGADSFLTREPHALDLAKVVGLGEELVDPGVFGGLVWDGEKTEPLPRRAFMGIPTSPGAIWGATNLSVAGKLRALGDLLIPGRIGGEDTAVGPFLRQRFGSELTHRMVDPILAGTRSGDIDSMSLRYALPQIFDAAKTRASVIRSLAKASGGAPPSFKTPRAGMNALVTQVAGATPLEIRTKAEVRALMKTRDGWAISLRDGSSTQHSAVVIALPFHQAAHIFEASSPADAFSEPAGAMRSMPHASVASITLAYPPEDITWPPGSSGFLVPSGAQRTLAAGTWWSAKWPHTKSGASFIVRCFVGRSGRHPALDLDDEELAHRAAAEISELTGAGPPRTNRIDRWDDGLPQFEVGHHTRLRVINSAVMKLPGLEIAGPDLTGSGVPECVRQAEAAASRTTTFLEDAGSGGKVTT